MSWLKDIQQTITDALEPVDVFVNNYLDVYIWYVGFVFIIAGALLFLWKFKGIQFTNIKDQVKYINPMANIDKGKRDKNSMISSFQAFCVGMGARVGVGNITGVTSAIIMGGAGAIFWMWIFALLGAATSFVECTLGQIFKEKKSDGNFHGGPAYYIKKGLKNRKFALFIAFWIIVTYGVGFIANQAANSASAFTRMDALSGIDGITVILGLIFAAMTAFLIFGGVKKVAMASEIIVPIMVLIWLIIGFIAIIIGWEQIGWAVTQIFENAFNFKQIFAGFAGSCIMWGLKRGVFSNEAGIGSVPNVASSADVPHPIRQGLIQSIGVFVDTIIVCSVTAFMVLCCLPSEFMTNGINMTNGWDGVWMNGDRKSGWAMDTVQAAMSNAFGGDWILWVLASFMFVFAFSSLIAYYSMSEANLRFIKDDHKLVQWLRIVITCVVFFACIIPIDLVWDICDVFMAVMGICNIGALFMLYKYVKVAWDDWKKQKSEGIEEPVFDINNLDQQGLDFTNVTEWGAKQ